MKTKDGIEIKEGMVIYTPKKKYVTVMLIAKDSLKCEMTDYALTDCYASFGNIPQIPNGPCCVAGTMILTKFGWVSIELIGINDFVWTIKGHFKPVIKLYKRYVIDYELVCLKAGNRSLQYTEDPVFIDGRWMDPSEITTGQRAYIVEFSNNKHEYIKLEKKTEIYTGNLHNLGVLEDDSYIANGFCVHSPNNENYRIE